VSAVRSALAAAGVVAVLVGVAFVLDPGLAAVVEGTDWQVTLLGLLALVQGVRLVAARRHADLDAAETGDPEITASMPVPGASFDDLLADSNGRNSTARRNREQIRSRLRETAIEVVAWTEGCSRETAADRLEAGTWTDDPLAAAFLGDVAVTELSWLDSVRYTLSAEPRFQRRARRTADAIARCAGVEVVE